MENKGLDLKAYTRRAFYNQAKGFKIFDVKKGEHLTITDQCGRNIVSERVRGYPGILG